MKKAIVLLVLAGLLTSTSGLFSQNLMDNAEYRKGLEYQSLAKRSFDAGEYDKSMEYSALAQKHFQDAREYAEKMRQRYTAYNLKVRATDRLKYADYINAERHYPLEYTGAKGAFQAAESAFTGEDYMVSIEGYRQTLDLLKDIKPITPIPAEELARADTLRDLIARYNLSSARPTEYQRANTAYNSGKALVDVDNARARQLLTEANNNYQIVVDSGINRLAAERRAAMEAARRKADGVNAMNLAPEAYADGQRTQNSAEMMLRSRSYDDAWTTSGEAIAAYENSYQLAMARSGPTLPEFYTVRLIPERRDCFWRIAEYEFVYNDPWKWKLLYEENKHLLQEPDNPHLIQPGMRFRIPSLPGEKRSGDWQPAR